MLSYLITPPFNPSFLDRKRPGGRDELRLQFAGYGAFARGIVGDRIELFRDGLLLDFMFIAGYTLVLLAVFGFGALYFYRSVSRRFAVRALYVTGVMAVADICENRFLLWALNGLDDSPDRHLEWAAHCALIKWALAGPVAASAVWVTATLLSRGLLFWRAAEVKGALPPHPRALVRSAYRLAKGPESPWDDPDIIAPPAAPHASKPVPDWSAPPTPQRPKDSARARWRTRALQLPGRDPAEVGICVSGGGIRSASVTLGALQALREAKLLAQARYLVSVSGGGYMAGAFQLALTHEQPKDKKGQPLAQADLAKPEDAFAPGSPEEDHIRRHAKYLADSPREMLLALGTVLRGVLISLGVLALAFAVTGMYLGLFYRTFPVIDLGRFRPVVEVFKQSCGHLERPAPLCEEKIIPSLQLYAHAWNPILGLLGLAAAVSLVASFVRMRNGKSRPAWVRSTVKGIVGLALAITAYTVVFPAVIWFFAWLAQVQQVIPGTEDDSGVPGVSLLGAITAAATWVAALFTAAYKSVKKLKPDGEKAGLFGGGDKSIATQVGTSWVKVVVCWLVLLLVAFFGLAVLSWAAVYVNDWDWGWWLALPIALLILPFAIDQTTFSLHPFYRQRLAGAFAVRRAVMKDGSVGALPYDYNAEPTSLSTHAQKVDGFPQVIFAASAAVSLRNRTAPGRPAVPFSFASDYIGGPDTGWVRTTTMEQTARPLIRRDLTVQSAVAVSGAAFASAMGTQTLYLERLLALSNLRLGTWVPNPSYLAEIATYGPDWTMPRLPRVRRLRYQLQELVGRYSDTSPLLLCTDGGHFDNLGLVEMLRLRCRTIYVIDSSGDSPPLATTLAQAVTLAYEDLGVVIKFKQEEILKLVPGSAEPIEPKEPMAALNARFSASCVVVGDIIYPEPVMFPGGKLSTHGTIIFVKASLTPDMPYELLSYALKEKVFPRQSTFDQWFDHAQFNAYRALGHHLGEAAVKAEAADVAASARKCFRRRKDAP
ncbi:patatin-like phospholipase family protein [Streptomyces lunaelactis]|uniref:patatin-like phospholipase family protein n=1 Tax=Streptomyces lunaelactis TaxID=1535768 RepID=UPI00158513B1|nr:patatin-like phospholipase family protein [Streptomyces lunaelactis]NUK84540.1 patatin-like phospholipase family protein [Streptomyces lunaelactis]